VISSSQRPLTETHNTHNIQTYIHRVGFEPTISAGERPQTHALGGTASGTSCHPLKVSLNNIQINKFAVGGNVVYFTARLDIVTESYDQDFHKKYIRFVGISHQYGVRYGRNSQLAILQRTTLVLKQMSFFKIVKSFELFRLLQYTISPYNNSFVGGARAQHGPSPPRY